MAYTPLNIGAAKGDGAGEDLRDGGVKINAMLSDLHRQAVGGVPRMGLLHSRRIGCTASGTLSASVRTFHVTFAAECDFDLFRIWYQNDTASSYTVTKAVYAAVGSENAAGSYAPVNATGQAVAWNNITFGGNGANVEPTAATPAATASLTVAASATPPLKAYSFSDWMRAPSIPAASGDMRYLAVRTAMTGGSVEWFGTRWNATPSLSRGRLASAFYSNGDFTATTAITPGDGDHYAVPSGIQYYTRGRRGATVLAIGDSLTQGYNGLVGSSNTYSWAHEACATASTAARPVVLMNGGQASQTSANFYSRGKLEIDAFKPDVVTIAVYSPNDGAGTQAAVDVAWSRAVDFAHYAIGKGAVPILIGPIPNGTITAAADAFRLQIVSRIQDVAASGSMLAVDMNAAVKHATNTGPQTLAAEYNSGDGIHPNDAGFAAMGQAFLPALRAATQT